ncbi:hypothetical protein POM88_042771 [Heracleum sosnowskyi]|uniref:Endonuclease/exonuclease/phosphatase domain-containing protein n=1 Tax=Heracleum sosnowskyi TaxID=360622 RepID=A0AAD8HJH2_9APIA|nr:hypothetical protein POM88_042771 [Heracleum sosnowskyi]
MSSAIEDISQAMNSIVLEDEEEGGITIKEGNGGIGDGPYVNWSVWGTDRTKRRATWDLIRKLSGDSDKPWCIIGDMNNIPSQSEKKGGRRYPNWLVQGFRDVVEECELSDLDMQGYPFTWERGHGTAEWVEIRLDRALVTKSWTDIFQDAKLINMECSFAQTCWEKHGINNDAQPHESFAEWMENSFNSWDQRKDNWVL